MKVSDALTEHYRGSGLPEDGGRQHSHWNMLGFIRLRNFGWRRRALPCHDLHHVLTGYPCTVRGELQLAAWEFAAGRFPHAGASLFCLPLLGIGAVLAPRRSFAAFARGRRSRSLYAVGATQEMLALELAELRRRQLPVDVTTDWWDRFAYARLVGLSFAWLALPMAAVALLAWMLIP